jgi:hypothetical protein
VVRCNEFERPGSRNRERAQSPVGAAPTASISAEVLAALLTADDNFPTATDALALTSPQEGRHRLLATLLSPHIVQIGDRGNPLTIVVAVLADLYATTFLLPLLQDLPRSWRSTASI